MARRLSTGVVLALMAALLLLFARPARADVIDGDWCFRDGRHMAIKGPEIITPAGTRTEGRYSRHSFSYVVPPSDPGAGKTVRMILVNELTVNLQIGDGSTDAVQGPTEVWHRCTPQISGRETAPHAS